MKPPQRTKRLREIEVRHRLEDIDDEQGILVREREVAWRDMVPDIETLFIQHVLHVLEGMELGVLRAKLRRKISTV